MSTVAEDPVITEAQSEDAPPVVDHPFNSSAVVIDLDPRKIKIPKGRQKSFSMDDEKDRMFVNCVRHMHILQPPEVRKVGNDYELVFGRRRVWAAKQLGLKTIPVRVSNWTDDQVAWVATSENTHRSQLKPAQYLKQIQVLMAEHLRLFGPDGSQAVGGKARAKQASRDPQTRKFRPEDRTEPTPDEPEDQEPAKSPGLFAGSEAEPEPESGQFSRRQALAEATGSHPAAVSRAMRLAEAFTEEQLTVLDAFGVKRSDLIKLAALEDPLTRTTAVNLIAGGWSVDQAVQELSAMQADGGDQQQREEVRTAELSDEQWLEAKCADLRKLLQDTRPFDRDAVLWRHANNERNAFKARCKGLVLEALKVGWTPFAQFLKNTFWVEHPNDWYVCSECHGQNQESPQCKPCNGTGYRVKVGTPKK